MNMKRLSLLQACLVLFTLLWAGGTLRAQNVITDYRFGSTVGTYQEISGTEILGNCDDCVTPTGSRVPLGFTFKFFGTDFTDIMVCVNGWARLGGGDPTYSTYGNGLNNTAAAGILCPFWDDMYNVPPSSISYTTLGNAPTRVFVVQWKNMARCCGAANADYNYQIRLYETSNIIEFHYGTMAGAASSASIGFRNLGTPDPSFVSVSPGPVPTVSYTVANDNVQFETIASGTVYSFSLFPNIVESFPDEVNPRRVLRAGDIYDGRDASHLSPYVVAQKNQGQDFTLTYKIIGPITNDNQNPPPIYIATDNGNASDTVVDITTGSGLVRWDIRSAKGGPVYNAAGVNGALDLTNVPGGTYRVIAYISIPSMSYNQRWEREFSISLPNDIATLDISSPYSNAAPRSYKYPLNLSVPVSARFQNIGLNTIKELEVSAHIFQGTTLLYTEVDTVRNLNIRTGEILSYEFPLFTRTEQPGVYSLEVCTKLLKADINGVTTTVQDQQLSNNCIPRNNQPFTFETQYEIETQVVSLNSPSNGMSVCAQRPILARGVIVNNGIADASDIPVTLRIYSMPARTLVQSIDMIVPDAPIGTRTDVLFPQTLLITQPGQYEAELRITYNGDVDPIQSNNAQSVFFSVQPGLSGNHLVGTGYEFPTIQSAVDALYNCGVSGPVTFLLTDASYTVGDFNSKGPALDLTSTIQGVNADNTITWRPADNRIGMRGFVTITFNSGNGVGVKFGQNIAPSNTNAVAVQFGRYFGPRLANASGYMTFDGGQYKALRLRLQTNVANGHRAVVYIGRGASNYAIKNCLIDNAPGSPVSYATSLPKQNISSTSYTYEEDIRSNGATYSAGIIIRNTVPVNATGNNSEGLDTLMNRNNQIVGNEISGFGYGVATMGAGVLFQANAAKLVGYYNEGTQISDNTIWNVARAGIFVGFERGSTISGNRIFNVGTTVGHSGMAAGIIAGGESRYNNEKLTIRSNEISGVSSPVAVSGVYVEQFLNQIVPPAGGLVNFPSGDAQMRTYNNTIWGLSRTSSAASMAGIHYLTARKTGLTGVDALLTPAVADYFSQGDVIANNTIIMSNDNVNGAGAVVGIGIQHARSAELYNNAIAMLGSASASNLVHAALFYEGTMPGKSDWGLKSDYNAYWLPSASMAYVVETTQKSDMLSLGSIDEFKTVNQWRARTNQDDNSVEGNFTSELVYNGTAPAQKLRVQSNPAPLGSILNNRGKRLSYITTDIDGNIRGEAEMPYDLGADEFAGRLYVSDMEAIRIISPRTYKRESGMFSDAEYVMTKAPVMVTARVRNSGSLPQSDVKITARVYVESAATAGNPSIPAVYVAGPSMEKVITIADGTSQDITFDFSRNFRPQTYQELNYIVPGQFTTMSRNVTPRYKLELEVVADLNRGNDKVSKEVRFFMYRSKTGILVSEQTANITVPSSFNDIAGKLNADSLRAGLQDLGNWTYENNDYDRFERSAWEPYGVDYNIYRTVMWSNDTRMLTREQREDLRSFMSGGKMGEKHNLLLGSQEIPRQHVGTELEKDQAFVNRMLRAEYVQPGTPVAPNYENRMIEGVAAGRGTREVLRNTGFAGDINPVPSLVRVYSDATTAGTAEKAYRYMMLDAGVTVDGMGVVTTAPDHNVVFYGVEWRHVGRMAGGEAEVSGVQRMIKAALDYFAENGGWMVPVELANFDARKTGARQVSLNWETASEQNSAYFEVERREKGEKSSYNVVGGRVAARGNSSVLASYRTEDASVQSNHVYVYRLKTVDADGSYGYSREVEVDMSQVSEVVDMTSVRPNPAGMGDIVEARYTLPEGQTVTVELFDAVGRRIREIEQGYRTAGEHTVSINASELTSGWYRIVVRTANGQISSTLQIVK